MAEEEKGGYKVTDRRLHFDDNVPPPPKEKQPPKPSSPQTEPPPDFSGFLYSLGTSALIHLGEEAHPALGKAEVNLAQARQLIDLLALLEEKTRGNLTENEKELLTKLLFTLRMKFIEVSQREQTTLL